MSGGFAPGQGIVQVRQTLHELEPVASSVPIIIADAITASGLVGDQLFLTLEATTFTTDTSNAIHPRRQVVANIRLSLSGVPSLIAAIEKTKFVKTPAQGQRQ